METKNNRVISIDIARGIAIICIILGHLGLSSINRFVFTFHVPIFYFISGYFISDKKTLHEFVRSKFKSLIIPYIITCFCIIFLSIPRSFIKREGVRPVIEWIYASLYAAGDSYTEPFYIKGIGAIWFLWASFWSSLFLRISLNFNRYARIVFVIILFLLGYYSRSLFWFPLSIQAGACATLFMYIGYIIKKNKDLILDQPLKLKIPFLFISALVWFEFIINFKSFWLVHCDIGRGARDIIASGLASVVVITISFHISKLLTHLSAFLAFLGKNSLFMLCVHIVELDIFPWNFLCGRLLQIGIASEMIIYCVILLKLVICISITYVCSKLSLTSKYSV